MTSFLRAYLNRKLVWTKTRGLHCSLHGRGKAKEMTFMSKKYIKRPNVFYELRARSWFISILNNWITGLVANPEVFSLLQTWYQFRDLKRSLISLVVVRELICAFPTHYSQWWGRVSVGSSLTVDKAILWLVGSFSWASNASSAVSVCLCSVPNASAAHSSVSVNSSKYFSHIQFGPHRRLPHKKTNTQ